MNQLQQQWQAAALSFGLQPMATLPSAINSLAAAGGTSMSASFLPYMMQLAVAAMAGANQGMTAAADAADGAGPPAPGSSQWGLLSSEQPSRDDMGGQGGSVGDAQVCYVGFCGSILVVLWFRFPARLVYVWVRKYVWSCDCNSSQVCCHGWLVAACMAPLCVWQVIVVRCCVT
jgi:hypothetical protein